MNEPYLTMAEIESQFPNEWVFLANTTIKPGSLAPTGGTVVCHSANHTEFLKRIFDFTNIPDGAILFTGPPVLDDVEETVSVGQTQ